jgi:hypothetical protein
MPEPRGQGGRSRSRHLKCGEKRCGFRCFRCGGENRLLVGLEDRKPRCEILRVIGPRLIADAEIGTEERGSEFGDELLDRIGLIAEALPELPVAAAFDAGPVTIMPISA